MDLYLMADRAAVKEIIETGDPREEALLWFDRLRDPLRRYLMCAGVGAADADDAIQESFLRLYQHLAKGGDRANLWGWIFQVARNYLRDERKSARRRRTVTLDDAAQATGVADSRQSPEHSALDDERTRRLRAAIHRLPEQQRECMLLRASGLRYREIAKILGIQTASVGTLVHRAVARLSEDLA
jgi:RNA polymerase sigma-70 factor (ECF subfamily)